MQHLIEIYQLEKRDTQIIFIQQQYNPSQDNIDLITKIALQFRKIFISQFVSSDMQMWLKIKIYFIINLQQ